MKRNKEMKLSIALHSAKYILTAIFIALNLLGVVHWYWVWIVSPLLISLAIKVILLLSILTTASTYTYTLQYFTQKYNCSVSNRYMVFCASI